MANLLANSLATSVKAVEAVKAVKADVVVTAYSLPPLLPDGPPNAGVYCLPSPLSQSPLSQSPLSNPLPSTLPELQKEKRKLRDRRLEEQDFLGSAAIAYGVKTSKRNKRELQRAMRSLKGIDEALALVSRNIRALKAAKPGQSDETESAQSITVAGQTIDLAGMTEEDVLSFWQQLTGKFPGAADAIAASTLEALGRASGEEPV